MRERELERELKGRERERERELEKNEERRSSLSFVSCHRSQNILRVLCVCGRESREREVEKEREISWRWILFGFLFRIIRIQLLSSPLLSSPITIRKMSLSLPTNKTYLDLVNEAILSLEKRSGSSLQAIKQHIHTQYPDLDLKSVS